MEAVVLEVNRLPRHPHEEGSYVKSKKSQVLVRTGESGTLVHCWREREWCGHSGKRHGSSSKKE